MTGEYPIPEGVQATIREAWQRVDLAQVMYGTIVEAVGRTLGVPDSGYRLDLQRMVFVPTGSGEPVLPPADQ